MQNPLPTRRNRHLAFLSKEGQQARAAEALAEIVRNRAAMGDPVLKTEAEDYLLDQLSRDDARAVIFDHMGKLWRMERIECRKRRPKALSPLSQPDNPRRSDP